MLHFKHIKIILLRVLDWTGLPVSSESHAKHIGMGRMFASSVCLSVCLSGSETNDPEVFKLGIQNGLGIS